MKENKNKQIEAYIYSVFDNYVVLDKKHTPHFADSYLERSLVVFTVYLNKVKKIEEKISILESCCEKFKGVDTGGVFEGWLSVYSLRSEDLINKFWRFNDVPVKIRSVVFGRAVSENFENFFNFVVKQGRGWKNNADISDIEYCTKLLLSVGGSSDKIKKLYLFFSTTQDLSPGFVESLDEKKLVLHKFKQLNLKDEEMLARPRGDRLSVCSGVLLNSVMLSLEGLNSGSVVYDDSGRFKGQSGDEYIEKIKKNKYFTSIENDLVTLIKNKHLNSRKEKSKEFWLKCLMFLTVKNETKKVVPVRKI